MPPPPICVSINSTLMFPSFFTRLLNLTMPRRAGDQSLMGRVVGDVFETFSTCVALRVTQNNREIVNGAEFRPSAVLNQPRVLVGGEDYTALFTLVMVDPDAPNPSNPSLREYLHWLVVNIPGTTEATYGEELTCYENPQPAVGIHRIIFMLFRQLDRLMVDAPSGRENFQTRQFSELHNLGSPVAVVYFNCQRERGSGGRRFTS